MSINPLFPGLGSILKDGRGHRTSDLIAGVITGLVLVPQAVAFAQLAGLPPEVGLAASVLPMLIYALLGSSRTLSVGPVSVAALMVGEVVLRYPNEVAVVVPLLAAQGALILLLLVVLRLEVLTRVFSHTVLGGFTVASALLIVGSQLKPLLGGPLQWSRGLAAILTMPTLYAGLSAVLLLYAYNQYIGPSLQPWVRRFLGEAGALLVSRMGPLLLLSVAGLLVYGQVNNWHLHWATVGKVPSSVVKLDVSWIQAVNLKLFFAVLPSAIMIALVGYVESFAVAQSLAQRRRENISVRAEMLAISAANGVASMCGAMPVAGGFSRSMVNFSAGASTQLAAVVAASFSFIALLLAADAFLVVPKFILGAIIIVSILPLIKFQEPWTLWRTDRAEALTWLTTFLGVLIFGIEAGLIAGATLGILTYLASLVEPHVAIVGRMPGTEHFRNISRHAVETLPGLLLIRFDESLTFLNAPSLKRALQHELSLAKDIRQVVLSGAAMNRIDITGAHTLIDMARDLNQAGVGFHLAEVKGPVLDYLAKSAFESQFSGRIFLSFQMAIDVLSQGPMLSAKKFAW